MIIYLGTLTQNLKLEGRGLDSRWEESEFFLSKLKSIWECFFISFKKGVIFLYLLSDFSVAQEKKIVACF